MTKEKQQINKKKHNSKTKNAIDEMNNRMDMTKTWGYYPEAKCDISLNIQKRKIMGTLGEKLRDSYGQNCVPPNSYVEALSTYLQYSLSLCLK